MGVPSFENSLGFDSAKIITDNKLVTIFLERLYTVVGRKSYVCIV